IEEMLRIGQGARSGGGSLMAENGQPGGRMGFVFDLSRPIDFAEIEKQMTGSQPGMRRAGFGFEPLPCPLVVSGVPGSVCEQLNSSLGSLGLVAVAGVGGGIDVDGIADAKLVPGSPLAIPFVTGDISMTGIGTVTEVVGDQIYGLGHGFLSYGQVDLPMATGQIHTVVSNMMLSFKLGSALETVGALRFDESTGVKGMIGAKAGMIPLTVKVDRYNDTVQRIYNCEIVNSRLLTPLYLQSVIAGAAILMGNFPVDHMIEYKVDIEIEGGKSIRFENVSTGMGIFEMLRECIGSVALLMNNPYKEVNISSMHFEIVEVPKNLYSRIWSAGSSDLKVKSGENVRMEVILESVKSDKKKYEFDIAVPEKLAPGNYELGVMGAYEYQQFLARATPYKYIPRNLPGLVEALNELLSIRRDRLYCMFLLPPGGISVESSELPDLPATKALIIADPKRTLITHKYQQWIEKSYHTGKVVMDKKVLRITVE
ncbi:MAG: hypothetical protein ACYTBP_15060, partial [Planctomycetota bacterium]